MDKLQKIIEEIMEEETLIYSVLSNLKDKSKDTFTKVSIKPVLIKNEKYIQLAYEYKDKIIHKNLKNDEFIIEYKQLFLNHFKQGMIFTLDADYQILISKKGKVSIFKKKPTRSIIDLDHNRKKAYIIEEGIPCDFLIELGVMSQDGKVFSKKYDKFRQINKFLELVSDVVYKIEDKEKINIVDFGCGKSYLTFALYYYLKKLLNLDVNIIGLDLKKDVIELCNNLALELDYKGLQFINKDIRDFEELDKVDMVVTLHACDTATDEALIKAVSWNTDIILSVPCCQHELFNKIENKTMTPMLKHGIIKERLSSLITDSLRANVLEILGYDTQLLEFIDMEHTPKNIMIRAIKSANPKKIDTSEYLEFKKSWNIDNSYIERRVKEILGRTIL
ncbi:MAG: SAM-dependent methyltransferase [Gudongella sp.]|nr:SAM-dependent methyltransferase [Gudongella sp.]